MSEHGHLWRLYNGQTRIHFLRNKKWFIAFSAVIIAVGLTSIFMGRLNFGLDFKGGSQWRAPAVKVSDVDIQNNTLKPNGVKDAKVFFATSKDEKGQAQRSVVIQANIEGENSAKTVDKVTDSLAKYLKINRTEIDVKQVSSSWGAQITEKALRALIGFFIVIFLYIMWRFEPKMAIATFVALIHDILITLSVYALAGFQVTPATVIAVLTIQGYSIYDTIVVFDKIDENTRTIATTGRVTYSDMVDLSLNQVLMRSINTSLTALIPIASMLIVGSFILGVTALEDFGVALFIGLSAGAYSSLFIAAPVLAALKEREPRYANIRARLAGDGLSVADEGFIEAAAAGPVIAPSQVTPRARKKGKRR